MRITAKCNFCGYKENYELSPEEAKTLAEYRYRGREMGYLQDLFPNVPAWIRSGTIDLCAGGFCICPKCMEGLA